MPRQSSNPKGDKSKALDVAFSQIEKQFGKGSIMRLGSDKAHARLEVIPTKRIAIDLATGIGGFPRGRIVEVYGPESSGKTTLALHAVASAQEMGGTAAFVDAEHALDPIYAGKLGVNVENLLVSQPDNGEQALEITDILVRSSAVDIVVVDSVAALVPRAEIEGEMGDSHVGLQARLMSQALRKLTGSINRSKTCCVFINQIREKIGVMFGSPETTTGGRALKFYASMRIEIRRGSPIKDSNNQAIGSKTYVKFVKNKCAPPFRNIEVDMMFGEGVSKEGMLLDLAIEHDLVQRSGAWFSYGDMRLGQGRDNVKQLLKENKELYEELEQRILAVVMPEPVEETAGDETATPDES